MGRGERAMEAQPSPRSPPSYAEPRSFKAGRPNRLCLLDPKTLTRPRRKDTDHSSIPSIQVNLPEQNPVNLAERQSG